MIWSISQGWAACDVDLMFIMDEFMKPLMHLWSVNKITYSICPFLRLVGCHRCLRLVASVMKNGPRQQFGCRDRKACCLFTKHPRASHVSVWLAPCFPCTSLSQEESPTLRQEGALEDSLHSNTLLEGFGRCSRVEHSAWKTKISQKKSFQVVLYNPDVFFYRSIK